MVVSVKEITRPSKLPVTLQEVKAYLRVDTTDEDTVIASLIAAATDAAINFLGRALVPQKFEAYFESFDYPALRKLPYFPILSVESVFYKDSSGVVSEIISGDYGADDSGIYPPDYSYWPESFVGPQAVRVRYTAGYTPLAIGSPTDDASGIPEAIKTGIKLTIGDLYQNREAGALVNGATYEANPTVKNLWYPYRQGLGM